MLREGIEIEGESIPLDGLADPNCTRIEGIPQSEALLCFANAFMGNDKATLSEARERLVLEMGAEAMVDVVGVASIFQRTDRVADATGIRSDEPIAIMQEDLTQLLGTDKYLTAGNTKSLSWIKRLIFKLFVVPKLRKMIKKNSAR